MTEGSSIVWRRSRWVTLLYLIILIAFVALSWSILANGASATRRFSHAHALIIGWFGLSVSSPVAAIGLLELINPTRLIARPEGFEQKGLWQHPLIPWSEVTEFVVWRQVSHNVLANAFPRFSHVGYRLTEEARVTKNRGWRQLFTFGLYDGWLMSGVGKRPQEIADLLESLRVSSMSRLASG